MTIPAFPKIFAIGTKYIQDIWKDEVEITEKLDGSQLVFGRDSEGELRIRSKGKKLFFEAPEKMFAEGVDYVNSIADRIPNNTYFYCEYLKNPKHNTLVYNRIPKNHLVLFGVSTGKDCFESNHSELLRWSDKLEIDCVPLLYRGMVTWEILPFLKELLQIESYLGGPTIEGVVIKNYNRSIIIGGQVLPLAVGKFVSESFKERHNKEWKKQSGKGKWKEFCESFRTEARWNKAIQHLKEKGELEEAPKDIGKVIKEIQKDIIEEEKDTIKDFLWDNYSKDVLRTAIRGFPEWFKETLIQTDCNNG
ncbi:MAG: hypothetical protein GF364_03335 [Candidatus Lokiarchaeota archaeon]|nr:hypothetical protein [Candidatus Lokiarchaeota archaeon]